MNTLRRIAGLSLVVGWIASPAAAHPGHGEPGAGHYVTDPTHLAVVVVLTTLVLFAASCGLAAVRRRVGG